MNYVSFFGSSGQERHSRQKLRKRNAPAGRWETALTARERKQRDSSQAGIPAIPPPKMEASQRTDTSARILHEEAHLAFAAAAAQLDTAAREPAARLLPSLREETNKATTSAS